MAVSKNVYRRKQRNTGTRKRKPIVFLIAEGKNKTETIYFKDFAKDNNRIIRFAPGNHTDPVNLGEPNFSRLFFSFEKVST